MRLRAHNDSLMIDEPTAILALGDLPAGPAALVEAHIAADAEQSADAEAASLKAAADSRELQDALALQAQMDRQLETDPRISQPGVKKSLTVRRDRQAALVERIKARIAKRKKSKKTRTARMHTSRLLQQVLRMSRRPARQIAAKIPKKFAGDPMAAIAAIRADIEAIQKRGDAVIKAPLPREVAKARWASIVKSAAKEAYFPFADLARVDELEDGRLRYAPIDSTIDADLIASALVPHLQHLGNTRLDAMFDKLDAPGGEFDDAAAPVEYLTLGQRQEELKKLRAELDRLEIIEAHLLFTALADGHKTYARPDAFAENMLCMEPDPTVEVETPDSPIMEIAHAARPLNGPNAGASFKHSD